MSSPNDSNQDESPAENSDSPPVSATLENDDNVAGPMATVAVAQNQAMQQPSHPFYTLPSELILDIVDLLSPDSFINFAFANYPLLHAYGLAPALSPPRVTYITTQTRIPALFPLLRMPAEIMLHIMRNLKPIDIMRFVVANYQDLARSGIAPPMTPEIEQELRNIVRRRLGR